MARVRHLTAVPGTAAALAGVVNHRGRILALLDLRPLLELPPRGARDLHHMLVVQAGAAMLALLIDAVISVTPVETADIAAPPAGAARRDAVVFGVTSDLVTVLDLPALAGDARIVVNAPAG